MLLYYTTEFLGHCFRRLKIFQQQLPGLSLITVVIGMLRSEGTMYRALQHEQTEGGGIGWHWYLLDRGRVGAYCRRTLVGTPARATFPRYSIEERTPHPPPCAK